ncbi:allophanate hydrolase [Synergistales bacterium]|nr:allophanate hydrolase [Synergistales bacterium]
MSFVVEKPGMLSAVQDLGRWGHQSRGLSVSGPMDQFSLRMGNVMLGNDENDAAIEITLFGLDIVFNGETCVVLTGADVTMNINGSPAPAWTAHYVTKGTRLAVTGLSGQGRGCRSYLCVSGGIDVPIVMGSRSTFTKGKIGGYKGRALMAGDAVNTLEPKPLWRRSAGFICPRELRPDGRADEPLYAIPGPQEDAFTEEGIRTFYGSEYAVTNDSDRMGYRLEGPVIEHGTSPDIISDGIVFGAVQVPGDGRPIVMMADRQTTGGYAKIAVLAAWSAARLAQRMPGEKVRFRQIGVKEATKFLEDFAKNLNELDALRAAYRSR